MAPVTDLPPTHAALREKERTLRSGFPETMRLRVHRSISWLGRAEAEEDDDDARFVFLWIAFNAAYADQEEFLRGEANERSSHTRYFRTVVGLDTGGRVYDAIWDNFSGPIRLLMDNKYVFGPFWHHHNGVSGWEGWESRFRSSRWVFRRAVAAKDTVKVLSLLFDRLYVLRNQLVHGGSTWNSIVNRDQVRDGTAILSFLVPVFVDVMMENPHDEWGRPFYPVVA